MDLSISGTIEEILPVQTGNSARGPWTKLAYVVRTTGQYPKSVAFDYWKADPMLKVGDQVVVHFNVESRKHSDRWYTTVTAWKIHVLGASSKPAADPDSPDEPEDWGDDDEPPF